MKRIRLNTLLMLVVIAALCLALMVQDRRAARRMAELEAKLAKANEVIAENYKLGIMSIEGDMRVTKRGSQAEGTGR